MAMRLLLIISFLVFLSCKKDKGAASQSNRKQIESIKEPSFFYDSLGKGELYTLDKIAQIKRYRYGFDNYYFFYYYPGTNKVKSIYYKPASHQQSCAFSQCNFFYKDGRIDNIQISSPSSACEVIVKTFQFAYFPKGALKSIVQEDDLSIKETYFAYDNAGRVSKMYGNGRYKNETSYRFGETSISYDLAGNVVEITHQPQYSNTISDKYNYSYDTTVNPFKGIYIPQEFISVFGWSESLPSTLSNNVVKQTKRFYASNSATHTYPYILTAKNGRLQQFYYFDSFGSTFYYY